MNFHHFGLYEIKFMVPLKYSKKTYKKVIFAFKQYLRSIADLNTLETNKYISASGIFGMFMMIILIHNIIT